MLTHCAHGLLLSLPSARFVRFPTAFVASSHCRGAVETVLLLEGDGDEVVEDPLRSAFLEVWTDVGSNASSQQAASSSSSPPAIVAGGKE